MNRSGGLERKGGFSSEKTKVGTNWETVAEPCNGIGNGVDNGAAAGSGKSSGGRRRGKIVL